MASTLLPHREEGFFIIRSKNHPLAGLGSLDGRFEASERVKARKAIEALQGESADGEIRRQWR